MATSLRRPLDRDWREIERGPAGCVTWDGPQKCVAAFGNDGRKSEHLHYLRTKLNEHKPNSQIRAVKTNDVGGFVVLVDQLEDATLIWDWLDESWAVINGKVVDGERDPERDAAEQRVASFFLPLEELPE